jgi:hypothetical protein
MMSMELRTKTLVGVHRLEQVLVVVHMMVLEVVHMMGLVVVHMMGLVAVHMMGLGVDRMRVPVWDYIHSWKNKIISRFKNIRSSQLFKSTFGY